SSPTTAYANAATAPTASSADAAPPGKSGAAAGARSDTKPYVSAAHSDTDAYARAHALHFRGGDPAAALAAWDAYLAIAPGGPRAGLVLEARWNRAICLVRLRRRDAALVAPPPFADGGSGHYRRDGARPLV